MAGIAAEIATTEPDVVSLQEATLYRTGRLSFTGALTAGNVAYDQLGLLMSALAADGAHYRLVSSLKELDAEAPDIALGEDVRITDYDAMLVRSNEPANLNFTVNNPQAVNYKTTASAATPSGSIPVYRGWISADITSLGRTVRVTNTHLGGKTTLTWRQHKRWRATFMSPTVQRILSKLWGSFMR